MYFFFFFKQKTAYEMLRSLVGSEMCIRDRYKPMRDLSNMTDTMSKAAVGYERIRAVIETENEVRNLPGARKAPALKGAIEFEHVDFGYDKRYPTLTDVNLRVEPGQLAALVGPTGAGKSTITGLIGRFYDPQKGVVKID